MTHKRDAALAPLWTNNADEPCGARDVSALLPVPVHYDCKGCRERIVEILLRRPRKVASPPVRLTQTDLFDDLQPVRPRRD